MSGASWTMGCSQRGFQPELAGRFADPILASIRSPARHATTDRLHLHLRLRLRFVDQFAPTARIGHTLGCAKVGTFWKKHEATSRSVLFRWRRCPTGRRPSRSPSPGQRPGERWRHVFVSAQRANGSSGANDWPVGPKISSRRPRHPGRCPGLGERLPLRGKDAHARYGTEVGINDNRKEADFFAAQAQATH